MLIKNKIIQCVLIVAFLLAGAIGFVYFIKSTDYWISREIDPVGLLTLVFTSVLALSISRVLGKYDQQERIEKDLLIDEIKNFKSSLILDVRGWAAAESIPYMTVISNLKNHRQGIYSVLRCADEYGFLHDGSLSKKIEEHLKTILDLFTGTAPDGDGLEPGIQISDDIIKILGPRKTIILNASLATNRLLFDLVVDINRS